MVLGLIGIHLERIFPEQDGPFSRKRFGLELLSLPRAEYPNVVASARELVDAQFSWPQQLLKVIVDFTVAGVEALRDRRKARGPRRLVRRGVPIRTDTYVVGDALIWGATARILGELLERIDA